MMMMVVFVLAVPALACGFLVSANGAVRLGKTSTFVAWEEGIEHYITNFTFAGPGRVFRFHRAAPGRADRGGEGR